MLKEQGIKGREAASALAEAIRGLASRGLTAADTIAALPVVVRLAAAMGVHVASATDMLTDALQAVSQGKAGEDNHEGA